MISGWDCGLNWVFSAHFMIICKAFYEMLSFVLRLVVTVLSQWMSYWDIPLRYTQSKYQYPLICHTLFVREKWALGYWTQTINNFCTEMCSLQISPKLLLAIIKVFSETSVCHRNFKRYFNKHGDRLNIILMALLDVVLQVGSRDRMTVSRSCLVMAVNTMNRPGAGESLLWVIMHHFPFYQGYYLTSGSAAKCHVCQANDIVFVFDKGNLKTDQSFTLWALSPFLKWTIHKDHQSISEIKEIVSSYFKVFVTRHTHAFTTTNRLFNVWGCFN